MQFSLLRSHVFDTRTNVTIESSISKAEGWDFWCFNQCFLYRRSYLRERWCSTPSFLGMQDSSTNGLRSSLGTLARVNWDHKSLTLRWVRCHSTPEHLRQTVNLYMNRSPQGPVFSFNCLWTGSQGGDFRVSEISGFSWTRIWFEALSIHLNWPHIISHQAFGKLLRKCDKRLVHRSIIW